MKLIFTLITAVLLAHSNFAQTFELYKGDTINRTDAAKFKQGLWVEFDPASKRPLATGKYKDNRREGLWKSYEEGRVTAEITYKEGRKKGFARTFYPDGTVAEEGFWDSNKWVGNYKAYHRNGKVAYDWTYNERGKKEGPQRYFHPNGKVMLEGSWTDGKLHGMIKEYYADGKLRSERTFNQGIIDTNLTREYEPTEEDTQIVAQNTKKDLPEGNTVAETESEVVTVFYETGFRKLYTQDKQVSQEGEFRGGKLYAGKKYIYNEQKKLIRTIIYADGKATDVINAQ